MQTTLVVAKGAGGVEGGGKGGGEIYGEEGTWTLG